jgi:hypothetical protein
MRQHITKNGKLKVMYIVLHTLVIIVLVRSLLRGEYHNVFLCLLTIVLFMAPAFVEKNLGLHIPTLLESVVLMFIFAAEILGEVNCYYQKIPHWDTMLHTINGFMCAAIGFALLDILNKNTKVKFQLSPVFLAVVAFCFSMTIGVLWEFFEFAADTLFLTDMQKDTVIHTISTVTLDTAQTNTPQIIENITSVAVNGEVLPIDGYLDIGLYDTMKDLFVNFIGAVIFSIIGYFYVKSRGKGKVAKQFIPVKTEDMEE